MLRLQEEFTIEEKKDLNAAAQVNPVPLQSAGSNRFVET